MYFEQLLKHPALYPFLELIDRELARLAHQKGCRCGGKLHRADYPRSPRGGLQACLKYMSRRFSFCCASDGCRKRATPPSARFFGRRHYTAAVLALVSPRGGAQAHWLCEQLEVAEVTVNRWRHWWRVDFLKTPFWKLHRADFIEIEETQLPQSLHGRFEGKTLLERLILLLRFLAPVNTPAFCA